MTQFQSDNFSNKFRKTIASFNIKFFFMIIVFLFNENKQIENKISQFDVNITYVIIEANNRWRIMHQQGFL